MPSPTDCPSVRRVPAGIRRFALALRAAAACAAILTGCGQDRSAAAGPAPDPWFEDVAAKSGVDFTHESGHKPGRFLFPEVSGGGCALLDYDGDGRDDIYLVQSGRIQAESRPRPPNRLFRNLGAMKFEDVTDKTGVQGADYGMGVACADYDGDGFVDIFVTNLGRNILYRNSGGVRFVDATDEAGISKERNWSTSAVFADYDRDGVLDLYVANYIRWAPHLEPVCRMSTGEPDYCGPTNYRASAVDTLYHGAGKGRFKDVSREAGLEAAFGNGFGVVAADFNGDGWIDFYVANDGTPNQLWINDGRGRFTDEALISGCAVSRNGIPEAGMGAAAVDLECAGSFGIFVTNLRNETNDYFRNDGKGRFDERVALIGLGTPSLPMTGFGCAFADFDDDGLTDLYVANGAVMAPAGAGSKDEIDRYGELNQVFRGLAGGKFAEVKPAGGTAVPLVDASRGCAVGDLDGDGALDLVVMNKDRRAYVLRNVVKNRGAWAALKIVDGAGRDALGAVAYVESSGRRCAHMVMPSYGFSSSNDPRVHVGLGAATRIDRVTIKWPQSQKSETFGPLPAGRIHELREGAGR